MSKIDKNDLKSPDKLQAELQKGFQWTTQHSKLVGLALLGLLLVGAGVSAKSYLDDKKEHELQAKLFPIEKKLMEKKSAYELGAQPPPKPADPKAKTPTAPEAPKGEKASGNFDQDYGPIAQEMTKLIDEAPKSKAAKMAALNLAEIQLQYNQLAPAQATLSKVNADSRDLLSGMVAAQLGTVQANQNDCNAAISTWQKVLANSSAKALHPAVKLKKGLCYEKMNDLAKAEQAYSEVLKEDKELAGTQANNAPTQEPLSATARAADKYLRLLQTTKKN